MKTFRIAIATLFVSTFIVSSSTIAQAAPSGGLITNPSCTGVKSTGVVTAGGTYQAPNSDNKYKINGYRITLLNTGGQQLRTSGLVSIQPTWAFNASLTWTLTKTEGNSLKSALIQFYNGGTLKASATTSCTWI